MVQTARWFALLCLTLGCGGKVEEATPDAPAPTIPPPTARPTMSPPVTAGTMPPPPSTTMRPPAPRAPEVCPELSVDLSFDEGVLEKNSIAVELVQKPEFTEATQGTPGAEELPPEQWDRADVPEGACVFRLRGVPANCYAHVYSSLQLGQCDDAAVTPRVLFTSFYERHRCSSIAPGCAGAEWLHSRGGYHWYLTQQGDDTLVVSCAPQCRDVLAGTDATGASSCLSLAPEFVPAPTCR